MSQQSTPEEEKRRTLSPATPRTTTKTAPPVSSSQHSSRQSSPAPAYHTRDGSASPVDKRRHASIAGIGVGVTPSYSPTRPPSGMQGHTSPRTTTKTFPGTDHRRSSDSTTSGSRDKRGDETGRAVNSGSTSPNIPHIVLPRRTGKFKKDTRVELSS
jgi:hypothetical protein